MPYIYIYIYTGFENAFDKIPHQLLQKQKLYKVYPSIINGIKAFLCFRKQRVRLNGFFSEWTEVIGGIPQGTILDAMLFIIYSNDLPDMCKQFANVYLFADDAKLYRHILSNVFFVDNSVNNIHILIAIQPKNCY